LLKLNKFKKIGGMRMFEYVIEIISIWISIKILKRIGKDIKEKGLFEDKSIGRVVKFGWWLVVFFTMITIWALFEAIIGMDTKGGLTAIILFSSINGFSSRYYGKVGYWVMVLFTFIIGIGANSALWGFIVAMTFFFATRRINGKENMGKIEASNAENNTSITINDDLDLLNKTLLNAKELSSKALDDFQNNNLNDAIKKWTKSLEYYKKAEKIAKSNKDEELISSINNNIKSLVRNILDAKIKLTSDKIEGMV